MSIEDVYIEYKIMPNLRVHQYRVAAVGRTIAEKFDTPIIEIENITIACLLHDMGNIIKFRLDLFPEFLVPEGLDYWKSVQNEYFEKYGQDEHVATNKISEEILSRQSLVVGPQSSDVRKNDKNRVLELIDAISFSEAVTNSKCDDFNRKIVAYSDTRVDPHGVTSQVSRLQDGKKRFRINKKASTDEYFESMAAGLKEIEKEIFDEVDIEPQDITDEYVKETVKKLHNYTI